MLFGHLRGISVISFCIYFVFLYGVLAHAFVAADMHQQLRNFTHTQCQKIFTDTQNRSTYIYSYPNSIWMHVKSRHFVRNLLQIYDKFELLTFKGSAETYIGCDGQVLHDFVANYICFPEVKEIENRLRFDKFIADYKVGSFFETRREDLSSYKQRLTGQL